MQHQSHAACLILLAACAAANAGSVEVSSSQGLQQAARDARPGQTILLAPGTYTGGCTLTNLHGTDREMIRIVAKDPARPPIFEGGDVAFQLADCSYVLIEGIIAQKARVNNIQVGDGSHHIILKDVVSRDIAVQSNCDGIKMPGLTDFLLYNCTVENWGGEGSAIDMVGCARGLIYKCTFRYPNVKGQTANAIQPKGGTHSLGIVRCRFDDASHRAIQFGGSTGKQYFFQGNFEAGHEGLDMIAVGNIIRGGGSAVAFISCTRCTFAFNTIIDPREYIVRILKEGGTRPTAGNTFANNLIIYGDLRQVLNHGGPKDVDLDSFTFEGNYWYNRKAPDRSVPDLPVKQVSPSGGQDPQLRADGQPLAPAARTAGALAPAAEAALMPHTRKFEWAWRQAVSLDRPPARTSQSQPAPPAAGPKTQTAR